SSGLEKVKGTFDITMTAAGDSVKEKLSNIKAAYEENGGGVQGVVAASMEGIKGLFTVGLTFVDNITGGKLTEIRTKFTQGLEGTKNIVSSTLTGIKDKFDEKITGAANIVKSGIEKIKNLFHFSWKLPNIETPHFTVAGKFSLKPPSVPQITTKWFAEGGVMTSPTIFGSSGNELLGGGEAGDEAILPLSSLWDKMGQFIHTEMNGGESAEKSESSYFNTITQREMRSVSSLKEVAGSSIKEKHVTEKEGKTVIQKLEIKVDLKNIKELKMLEKLINELTDAQNSSEEPEPT
ncbi:MAG: phage tail tape measure protein, partial [Roseburia sp.]|nr:phage tail tape measure protein [Roseburia sp.]